MNVFYAILFFGAASIVTNAQDTSFHYNGKPKEIGRRNEEGQEIGKWEFFFEDGSISSIQNYVDGQATGEWKIYHPNGKLESRKNYKNGMPIGLSEEYCDNGQLSFSCTYDETGEIDGEAKGYYCSGKLRIIQLYGHGKIIGESVCLVLNLVDTF